MKKHNISLFLFRRCLRLEDNTALIEALKNSRQVLACFIFDPAQITDKNSFKSNNAIQFMLESLQDLHSQLNAKNGRLYLFYGAPTIVLNEIFGKIQIDAVYTNRDYTPFSINRDDELRHLCHKNNVEFLQFNDLLLTQPEQIKTQNGDSYSIFTPFFKAASKQNVNKPQTNNFTNFYKQDLSINSNLNDIRKILKNTNPDLWVNGGTKSAKKILRNIKSFSNYNNTRDYPYLDTTYLSAHLKFGTCSVRQVYYSIIQNLGNYHPLIKQLNWRDFFTHIAYNSPFVFGHAFKNKYENLTWIYNKQLFDKWANGLTGFPIVDAGMRQLNATGFMHNRVRMITASFLIKDMHMNWLEGEKYFAQNLIDYDPAVNNGNWQWVASTGSDSQPYFRIFNPWLQQKKFDPQCIYIKRWIPELKNVESKIIHNIYKNKVKNYPVPILDHNKEVIITKKIYRL